VAFLKIDVDGYELRVLKGAEKLITRCKPYIFLEFYPDLMRSIQIAPTAILEFLGSVGLSHFRVFTNVGEQLLVTSSMSEVLATAESHPPYVDLLVTSSDN